MESKATLYIEERQRRETTADRDLSSAAQSTVWLYTRHLERICEGATISEEELECELQKYYEEAIDAFLKRTQDTICPYLLEVYQHNVIRVT